MKKLEIIIRPGKLEDVKMALSAVGVHGMNYAEIQGCGRQMGHAEIYRGRTVQVDFLPKFKLEVVVDDGIVESVVEAVCKAARTEAIGDGKIFITEVLDAIRIRTGERGTTAL
ncbi:P-II family nitrogen regulator [Desulfovibrio sp.]|uniref:P-II family nitrogen regulator n=1 Tax=Desulfovibrio sp. TaxID=885 RepID=UPI0025C6E9D5|nr:P-II family nitrogen regulator [Desulfovibrio sp.]MCI7569760.1 P-II family nitrogen regulator [Desulfovibrio sp.]